MRLHLALVALLTCREHAQCTDEKPGKVHLKLIDINVGGEMDKRVPELLDAADQFLLNRRERLGLTDRLKALAIPDRSKRSAARRRQKVARGGRPTDDHTEAMLPDQAILGHQLDRRLNRDDASLSLTRRRARCKEDIEAGV
ncbi:hypothetical protein B1812_16830 [Methylocystis bryophila]|uniref:Uncharacterized protein n=1 Tax=Methylocystis bryophila TaxID=655015 RepID=A0A1W6MY26_9HYPH|nr:hypothetical protein B1812_16830 [Methylocystis bryophila]